MNKIKEKLEQMEKEQQEPKIKKNHDEEHFWENYEQGWPYPDDEQSQQHE